MLCLCSDLAKDVRGRLLQALDELRILVLQLRRVGLLDPVRAVKAVGDRTAFM